jgi:hypothetical protein
LEELKGNAGTSEFDIRKGVMDLYQQTALAKISPCVEYIKEMLKQARFLKIIYSHRTELLIL